MSSASWRISGLSKCCRQHEDAAEQNRGIYRRDFRVPQPLAGIDVGEVVEKSPMLGQSLPKKAQRVQHSGARFDGRNEAALLSYAQRGEPETGGRDAGDHGVVGGRFTGIAAVLDQAGLGVGLLPEVADVDSLEFIKKLIIVRRKVSLGRRRRRLGVLLGRWRQERSESPLGEWQANPQAGHLSEKLAAGPDYGTKLPLIHSTSLNDPALRNDGRSRHEGNRDGYTG